MDGGRGGGNLGPAVASGGELLEEHLACAERGSPLFPYPPTTHTPSLPPPTMAAGAGQSPRLPGPPRRKSLALLNKAISSISLSSSRDSPFCPPATSTQASWGWPRGPFGVPAAGPGPSPSLHTEKEGAGSFSLHLTPERLLAPPDMPAPLLPLLHTPSLLASHLCLLARGSSASSTWLLFREGEPPSAEIRGAARPPGWSCLHLPY
ncbi:Hypothetical predicted protein [Podarcis lilfordi]|uniref:Uncharacterized protein n=1 Tax=Podarcis lilfordi TaxID=74358 RepID=A0AA35L9H0_9SAUR|nr:Hypothetical predicted protein [Podarcis lilfordi]